MPERWTGGKRIAHAELYAALAEALYEPPAWLARAGRDWPLYEAAIHVEGSDAIARAAPALAAIPPEPLEDRRRRYWQLFAGPGRPPLQVYESQYVDGRLLGPTSFAVEQIYRAAGLEVDGTERPDHASVELAFLGRLAEQEATDPSKATEWRRIARRFIKRHAGRWLPELGRSLAASGDPVYAPIGQLLADWITREGRPPRDGVRARSRRPAIPRPEACTLCSFCVQVCPTEALVIRETEAETGLVLIPSACIGCDKCERICEFGALRLEAQSSTDAGPVMLRTSPRAICPGCRQSSVSRAEMEAIAAGLGEWPRWLDYCLECRPILMEGVQ